MNKVAEVFIDSVGKIEMKIYMKGNGVDVEFSHGDKTFHLAQLRINDLEAFSKIFKEAAEMRLAVEKKKHPYLVQDSN